MRNKKIRRSASTDLPVFELNSFIPFAAHIYITVLRDRIRDLLLFRSTYRAAACTCTTADARILIDLKLAIALGDRSYRTCSCASATADARIFDHICHCFILLSFLLLLVFSSFSISAFCRISSPKIIVTHARRLVLANYCFVNLTRADRSLFLSIWV